MSILKKVFYFFFSDKRTLAYSAIGHEDYLKVIGKLQSEGVEYRTKRLLDSRQPGRIYKDIDAQYDIFVREEDLSKAQKAIHKRI